MSVHEDFDVVINDEIYQIKFDSIFLSITLIKCYKSYIFSA